MTEPTLYRAINVDPDAIRSGSEDGYLKWVVPVEPDYVLAAMQMPDHLRIQMSGPDEAVVIQAIVDAAYGIGGWDGQEN